MKLIQLKNKKILILGFGKEGKDNYSALRKLRVAGEWRPDKVLGIADRETFKTLPKEVQKTLKSDKKLKLHFGKNYLKNLKNYDLIIKTPGIPKKIIKPFLTKKQKVTSQTEIFLENCPAKIIGVTGTKGKGTTASLIYQILKKGGLKAKLVGNIGKPVFQTLLRSKKNDIFVYEISSHQLENLKKSPQIAVFLNLYPAHLDYYKNFKQYQRAKENISRHQTKEDFFIYNIDQKRLREIAKKTKAKKIPFGIKKLKRLEKIISKKEIPLKGEFNILNVMAAVSVAELFKISKKDIKKALKSFKSLPHRLEYVGKYRGIEFYNDSLATIPQASVAAIEALGNKVKTLIFGGMIVKGFEFSQAAKKILESKIKTLILFPDTDKKIFQEILKLKKKKANLPSVFFVSSMREALKIAYQKTKKGGVCLLSPGSPSFNLFRDYKDRGNLFKKFVRYYAKKRFS